MSFTEIPRAGLGAIQQGQKYVDGLANKFIVKPKTAAGIGGFVFDYEGEASVQIQAEITDHYVEDNSAVQDHIAKKPIRMSLRGYVGELVFQKPTGLLAALDLLQNRLTQVPAYLGRYTPSQIAIIQKAITKIQNIVNTMNFRLSQINNILGFFDNSVLGRTKQGRAYNKLQTLWANQQILLVETPYGMFNNMVVEHLTFVQDETTKLWTDIIVGLKQMNFVEVKTNVVNKNANRNAQQSQAAANRGQSKGTPAAVSDLKIAFPNLIPQ